MRARSRATRWIVAGSIAAVVCGGAVGVTLSPIFAADRVVVRGVRHLGADQVRRLSGLIVGTNVLYADLSHAVDRLERNGWVADANARRELPGTIVIEVTERIPVGLVTVDGRKSVVAQDGVLIDSWMPGLPRILPSIGAAQDSVADAAAALAALPESAREHVAAASIRSDGSLFLQLAHGIDVTYGPPVELEAKGRALAALLVWAEEVGARLAFVDVTVPQAPTARLAGGAIRQP
jgi:cell division protein FtsQ